MDGSMVEKKRKTKKKSKACWVIIEHLRRIESRGGGDAMRVRLRVVLRQ